MTANAFHNIAQIETSQWEAADQLRANFNLTATEYSMPVLGVIFLRYATTVTRPRCKPLRPRRRRAPCRDAVAAAPLDGRTVKDHHR